MLENRIYTFVVFLPATHKPRIIMKNLTNSIEGYSTKGLTNVCQNYQGNK